VDDALAAIAAADEHPNATMAAIGDRFPTAPSGWSSTASVPFSSARKWSAVSFGEHGSWFVGGADVLIGAGDAASGRVADAAGEGSRCPRACTRRRACRGTASCPPSIRPRGAHVMLKDTVRPTRRPRSPTSASRRSR
jgi:cation-transporting ATPase E